MTSVSAGHIILTPTQPVRSGRLQRKSNPGHPHQESRALPTELPYPHILLQFPNYFMFFVCCECILCTVDQSLHEASIVPTAKDRGRENKIYLTNCLHRRYDEGYITFAILTRQLKKKRTVASFLSAVHQQCAIDL